MLDFAYSSVDSMVTCKCAFTAKRRGKADILYIRSTEKLQTTTPEFSTGNSVNYLHKLGFDNDN